MFCKQQKKNTTLKAKTVNLESIKLYEKEVENAGCFAGNNLRNFQSVKLHYLAIMREINPQIIFYLMSIMDAIVISAKNISQGI
jgi:hypothetical protein